MSEQRWTAPKSGWYRYDSAKGFPLEFLGPQRPEGGDAEFYDQDQTLMDSGFAGALEAPRGPVLVVNWDIEPAP